MKKTDDNIEVVEERPAKLQEILNDLPEDLVKNLPTVIARLNSFITFYSTLNLKRLDKLTQYVIRAEEVLFDENQVLSIDNESLKENYKQAKNATLEILDLARKVAIQLPQEDKEVDEVYKLLKSLSPDTLQSIKESLIGISSKDDD